MDKGMGCQLRFEGLEIKWIPDRLELNNLGHVVMTR